MKKKYDVQTDFGEYSVILLVNRYFNNKNLAIDLFDPEDGPFARLTVNLSKKLPENQAYVDINNCPWAPDFIRRTGIGKRTGGIGQSGWCLYPLYEFDMEKLNEEA